MISWWVWKLTTWKIQPFDRIITVSVRKAHRSKTWKGCMCSDGMLACTKGLKVRETPITNTVTTAGRHDWHLNYLLSKVLQTNTCPSSQVYFTVSGLLWIAQKSVTRGGADTVCSTNCELYNISSIDQLIIMSPRGCHFVFKWDNKWCIIEILYSFAFSTQQKGLQEHLCFEAVLWRRSKASPSQ